MKKELVKTLSAAVLACGIAAHAAPAGAGEVKLAGNGAARAEIVLGRNAVSAAQLAAQELAAHLKAITGADFAVVDEDARTPGRYPIFVGAQTATEAVHPAAGFASQEYIVDIGGERTILVGRDSTSTQKVSVVYDGGPGAVKSLGGAPSRWSERGTLNAAYDFLRDDCGVKWLDCTEAGTIIPARPALAVKTRTVKGAPFTRCRDAGVSPEEWDRRRSPRGYEDYMRTAYPRAFAAEQSDVARNTRIMRLRELFALRLKLGGFKMHANHSFYWCYDRFWHKKDGNFIAYHPEWFSKHLKRDKQGRAVGDGVYSEVDTARRPAQMCYSNDEFVRQTIVDARAYFDIGGYTNRYTNQGVPCSAKHPVASWGKDIYCLEPMDNGSFCECEKCRAQYRPERSADSAKYSDYWFSFVNKVAREVKKSHPHCKISTLAYGSGREGLPSFRLEDNVIVHFCWDANRGPNREPLMTRQMRLMREWRRAYPGNPFGVWLYNGFPNESGTWYHYLPIPGFFGAVFDREMKFLRDLDMRECVFNCGLKDDFELYLGGRLMWNPSEDYAKLKDDFFSSYGPAENAVRRFYDTVEERYCSTNNFVDAKGRYYGGHMNRYMSWSLLCNGEVMQRLAECMDEAERAAAGADAQVKARLANWKKGYWEYMQAAKTPQFEFPSPRAGVKITCTECYGQKECAFGDKDVLEGRPFCVTGFVGRSSLYGLPKGTGDTPKRFTAMTTEPGFFGFWNGGMPSTQLIYRCDVKIARLKRLRIVTQDPARSRFFFNLVGWRGGEKVTIVEGVAFPRPYGSPGFSVWDVDFDPGAAPYGLDAIGIEERCFERKYYTPRYVRIRAADWGEPENRMTWFNDAKFGMFIHWGVYSVPAEGEWVMNRKRIPAEAYNRNAERFIQPAGFSPEQWVKLAVKAGMRYAVLTARHHDGFCLFDTKTTDFNSVKTAAKRDYVREFTDACRKHGLRVGLYFSIMNWQYKAEENGRIRRPEWDEMVATTHEALRELMTNYGRIDLLWYDGCSAPGCCDGEAMDRLWRTREMNAMVRSLQPWIVINDRSRRPEDFTTPEQSVNPPERGRAWESCMTMNRSWGYNESDDQWKSADDIWRSLLHCCRFGGNYLLNIGPRADGSVPDESVKLLEAIGRRILPRADGIYGSTRDVYTEATHAAGVVTKTRAGYRLFAFNGAPLDGVVKRVAITNGFCAVTLKTGAEKHPCNLLGGRHDVAVSPGSAPVLGEDPGAEQPPGGNLFVNAALGKIMVGAGAPKHTPGVSCRACPGKALKVPLPTEGRYVLEVGVVAPGGCPDTVSVAVPPGTKGSFEYAIPEGWLVYAAKLSPVWKVVAPEKWEVAGTFPSGFYLTRGMEQVREAFAADWLSRAKTEKFTPVPARNRLSDYPDRRVNFMYSAPNPTPGVGMARLKIDSAVDRTVAAALGVDWWADVYVNGAKVMPVSRLAKEKGDPEFTTHLPAVFKLPLKAGSNELLVVLHGGSGSDWLALWTNLP